MGLKFKFFPLGLAGEEAVFVMPLDGILFIGAFCKIPQEAGFLR